MTCDSRAVRQRRLHSRNGNALACVTCRKAIEPKRGSRRQKYCNVACKMKAARAKNGPNDTRYRTRYDQSKITQRNQCPAKAILVVEPFRRKPR
jgi:hypothetical protein